jgi:hypothetical protein
MCPMQSQSLFVSFLITYSKEILKAMLIKHLLVSDHSEYDMH